MEKEGGILAIRIASGIDDVTWTSSIPVKLITHVKTGLLAPSLGASLYICPQPTSGPAGRDKKCPCRSANSTSTDLLRGLKTSDFPALPIQADAIPPALAGHDRSPAVTGSKTAAFLLPILHKLMTKPPHHPAHWC